ncbi:MAG: hypothetical protein ACOYOA_08255 [Saprospiraceae bacterium]
MKYLLSGGFFLWCISMVSAQEFMMQGWYWDYFKQSNNGDRWAAHLEKMAADLKKSGITYMWLPPLSRSSTPNDTTNGYNPRDLYDYGNPINGIERPTMVGTRTQLNSLISTFENHNIKCVADLIYNHRDGGQLEVNPAVKSYTDNLNGNKDPFPCDRLVLALPLGAQNPGANGAGDYYFKFSSKTGNYGSGYRYNLYMRTSKTQAYLGVADETEPNGGGDCGQPFNTMLLGQDMRAYLGSSGNCNTDEFKLTLSAADLRNNGSTKDTLWIYMRPLEGGYADQRPYGLWSGPRSANIVNEILYMTYTDFNNMPSGKGAMNFENFRPNTANQAAETLRGDQNSMLFFYDYDQSSNSTKTVLNEWTRWNWDSIGIRGFRWDAVKHFPANYISDLLNYLNAAGINPGLVVGESYDGSPSVLKGWVDAVKSGMTPAALAAIQPKVFDFSLRSALRDACDYSGTDARNVFSAGVVDGAGGSGLNTITFINNHDFRSASGWDAPVQSDPMLAYAYILTNNKVGLPCIFYPDYYGVTIPHAPTVNLKSKIDDLITLHKKHIFGANQVEYLNKEGSFYQTATGNYISGSKSNALIYQIKGGASGKDVIVAINFGNSTLKVDHVINTNGNPVGTKFYDQLANSAFPFAVLNAAAKIYLEVPARSYKVWVKESPLPLQLNAKVLLGHADPQNGLMNDYLRNLPSFPLSDPYKSPGLISKFVPVNDLDTAKTNPTVLSVSGNNAIVDWVFIELRNGTSGSSTVVYTKAALLQKDGDIVDTDGKSALAFNNVPYGSYYVAIRHRNHLGFRTAQAIAFYGQVFNLNFTNGSIVLNGLAPLYCNPTSSFCVMNAADANIDGSIDAFDTIFWETQNGLFDDYSQNADYNLDGSIDSFDSILFEISNGKFEELD